MSLPNDGLRRGELKLVPVLALRTVRVCVFESIIFVFFLPFLLAKPRHVEVFSGPPLASGYMPQSGSHQHQRTVAIRKRTYHSRTTPNLTHDSFQRIVRPNPYPMLAWEGHVAERLADQLRSLRSSLALRNSNLRFAELANNLLRCVLLAS